MANDNNDRKKLYDALKSEYDNLGTWDEFDAKLNDENKRRALYDAMSKDFDNAGSWDDFNKRLMPTSAPSEGVETPSGADVQQQKTTTATAQQPKKYKNVRGKEQRDGQELRYYTDAKGARVYHPDDVTAWRNKTNPYAAQMAGRPQGGMFQSMPDYGASMPTSRVRNEFGGKTANSADSWEREAENRQRMVNAGVRKANSAQQNKDAVANATRNKEQYERMGLNADQFDAERTLEGVDANGMPVSGSRNVITETTDEEGNKMYIDADGNALPERYVDEQGNVRYGEQELLAHQSQQISSHVEEMAAAREAASHERNAIYAEYQQKVQDYDKQLEELFAQMGSGQINTADANLYVPTASNPEVQRQITEVAKERSAYMQMMADKYPDIISRDILEGIRNAAVSAPIAAAQVASDAQVAFGKATGMTSVEKYGREVRAGVEKYKSEHPLDYIGRGNEIVKKVHEYGGMVAATIAAAAMPESYVPALIGKIDMARMIVEGMAGQGEDARSSGAGDYAVAGAELANGIIWGTVSHYVGTPFSRGVMKEYGFTRANEIASMLEQMRKNPQTAREWQNVGGLLQRAAKQLGYAEIPRVEMQLNQIANGTFRSALDFGTAQTLCTAMSMLYNENVGAGELLASGMQGLIDGAMFGAFFGAAGSVRPLIEYRKREKANAIVEKGTRPFEAEGEVTLIQLHNGNVGRLVGIKEGGNMVLRLANGASVEVRPENVFYPRTYKKAEFMKEIDRAISEGVKSEAEVGENMKEAYEQARLNVKWQDVQRDVMYANFSKAELDALARESTRPFDYSSDEHYEMAIEFLSTRNRWKSMQRGISTEHERRKRDFRKEMDRHVYRDGSFTDNVPDNATIIEATLNDPAAEEGAAPRRVEVRSGDYNDANSVVTIYDPSTKSLTQVQTSMLSELTKTPYSEVLRRGYQEFLADEQDRIYGRVESYLHEGAGKFPIMYDGEQRMAQYIGEETVGNGKGSGARFVALQIDGVGERGFNAHDLQNAYFEAALEQSRYAATHSLDAFEYGNPRSEFLIGADQRLVPKTEAPDAEIPGTAPEAAPVDDGMLYHPGDSYTAKVQGEDVTITIRNVDLVNGKIEFEMSGPSFEIPAVRDAKIEDFNRYFSQQALDAKERARVDAERRSQPVDMTAGEGDANGGEPLAPAAEGGDNGGEPLAPEGEGTPAAPEREEIPVVTDNKGRSRKQYHLVSPERTLEDIAETEGYAGRGDAQREFVEQKQKLATKAMEEQKAKEPVRSQYEDPEDYADAHREWKELYDEITRRKKYWDKVAETQQEQLVESSRITTGRLGTLAREASENPSVENREALDAATRSMRVQLEQLSDEALNDRARNMAEVGDQMEREGRATEGQDIALNLAREIAEQRGMNMDEYDANIAHEFSIANRREGEAAFAEVMGDRTTILPEDAMKMQMKLGGMDADRARRLIDTIAEQRGANTPDWPIVDTMLAEQRAAAESARKAEEARKKAEAEQRAAMRRDEMAAFGEPQDVYEFVAMNLPPIDPEDFRKQTGYSGNDQRKYGVGVFARPENGGVGIERAAEILTGMDGAENWLPMDKSVDQYDTLAIRDVILDVLSEGNPKVSIKRRREEAVKTEMEYDFNEAYREGMESDIPALQTAYRKALKAYNDNAVNQRGYANSSKGMTEHATLEGMKKAIEQRGGLLPTDDMVRGKKKRPNYKNMGDVQLLSEKRRITEEMQRKMLYIPSYPRTKEAREAADALEAIEQELEIREQNNDAPFSSRKNDAVRASREKYEDSRTEEEKAMTREELESRGQELRAKADKAYATLEEARSLGRPAGEIEQLRKEFGRANWESTAFNIRNGIYQIGLNANGHTAALPESEYKRWDDFGKQLGVPVVVIDRVAGGGANGMYLNGVVFVAADAVRREGDPDVLNRETMRFVVGHESTHHLEKMNPEGYEAYKANVKTLLGDKFAEEVESEYRKLRNLNAKIYMAGNPDASIDEVSKYADEHTSREACEDEVVANYAGREFERGMLDAYMREGEDAVREYRNDLEREWIGVASAKAAEEVGEVPAADIEVQMSIRQKPEPKKKGIGYKVFYTKDGKLYPPMVANPDGADTPIGVWLDADVAPIVGESKTGRPQVKQGGKGTQGGSGQLAFRPGWHLGEIPYALQFNRKDTEGKRTLFPKDFVWAEVEYAADKDYQEEANAEGMTENGKFRHAYAGLKRLPEDGYYRYRTNPNPETDPWIITGAMKVNRILDKSEVDELVRAAGRDPQKVEGEETGVDAQGTVAEAIAVAEAETNTNPTEAQKKAGNYRMGHVKVDGYDISIENPKGSTRSGKDADGKEWSVTMNNTYGYIRGTEGVDGDHIDVFLSDDPSTGNVYVIDQVNADGTFDEHKVMYGFNSAEEARENYLGNYSKGWKGLGTITEVSKDEFKKWVESSHRKTKPFAEYKMVKAKMETPVSENRFGKVYNWAVGKVKEAFDFLAAKKDGYLRGVFHRDDLGDIDLAWGDAPTPHTGKGLAHIQRKHVELYGDFDSLEQARDVIADVIEKGELKTTNDKSVAHIEYGDYRVVVAKNSEGNWVLSAFDFKTPKKEKLKKKNAAAIGTPSQPVETEEAGAVTSNSSVGKGTENIRNEQGETEISAPDGGTLTDNGNGDVRITFSARSRRDEKALLDAMYKSNAGKWAKEDIEDMRKVGDAMMEGVIGLMAKHPAFENWNERMVLTDKNGNPVYSVFINNSDTEAPTIELSRNCVKKEAMNSLLTILRNEGNLSRLNNVSYLELRDILKKHGYDIACEMCFVESRRENVEAKARLGKKWNAVAKAAGFTGDFLDAPEGAELTSKQRKALEKIIEEEGVWAAKHKGAKFDNERKESHSGVQRIAALMMAYPEMRGTFDHERLYTPEGWNEILTKFGDQHPVMKFLASHDGSSTAKPTYGSHVFSQQKFMQDYGKLSKYFGESGIRFGGFRKHSFSDADPLLFTEDFQIHENLALTKSGMFGYTKVPYYVDMWGETGEHINMSLVVDIDTEHPEASEYAGLIQVGDPRHQKGLGMTDEEYAQYKAENNLSDGDWDYYYAEESFPVADAIRYRQDVRFGGKVGTVIVSASDAMTQKALDDPRIDMIIGWHSSSKMVNAKEKTGYNKAHDYTGENETSGNRSTTASKTYLPEMGLIAPVMIKGNDFGKSGYVDYNFNEACQEFGDARTAANAYLEWCDINGFTPAYEKFREHPNYYKLLQDFRRYDGEGNPIKMEAVKLQLPTDWAEKLDSYLGEREATYQKNTSEMASNEAFLADVRKALGVPDRKTLPRTGKFSVRASEVGDKTLYGAHNLSEEKLRKALKIGGLANPSTAVADIDVQPHTAYGEISLLMPSTLVEAKSGKNVGTYDRDAWTPLYPRVEYHSTKESRKNQEELLKVVENDELRRSISMQMDYFKDGNSHQSGLAYVFLKQMGIDTPIEHNEPKYGETLADIERIFGDAKMNYDEYLDLPREQRDEVTARILGLRTGKDVQRYFDIRDGKGDATPKMSEFMQRMFDEGVDYRTFESGISTLLRDRREAGTINIDKTIGAAYEYIRAAGMEPQFKAWEAMTYGNMGYDEKFQVGFKPDGTRIYKKNTLANVSAYMKKQGRNASEDHFSVGAGMLLAQMANRYRTLEQMRQQKGRLAPYGEGDGSFTKNGVSERLYNAARFFQSDKLPVEQYDQAWGFLEDAIVHGMDYDQLEKEYNEYFKHYGADLHLTEEQRATLDQLREDCKNIRPHYFETKFERPVGIEEFASAVVPATTGMDVKAALRNKGLDVVEYDANANGAYEAAIRTATEKDGIRFSTRVRANDPFYSNAAKAVEVVRQEKATADQWLAMIQKNGGLKAEEDKWMGLSEWLRAEKAKAVVGARDKAITKQEVEDFIMQNSVKVEDVKYGDLRVEVKEGLEKIREEFAKAIESVPDEIKGVADKHAAYKAWNDFGYEMYDKYGASYSNMLTPEEKAENDRLRKEWQKAQREYDNLQESREKAAYNAMKEKYGDDFIKGFRVEGDRLYLDATDSDGVTPEALRVMGIDGNAINETRLDYTTNGLENNREIALVVPTIDPYKEGGEVHFNDAGEGRAVAWIRFGETKAPRAITEEEYAATAAKVPEIDAWEKKDGSQFVNKTDLYYPPKEVSGLGMFIADYSSKGKWTLSDRGNTVGVFDSAAEAVAAYRQKYAEKMTKATNDRVLVIDEIQSKRHQDGREMGYESDYAESPRGKFQAAAREMREYKSSMAVKYGEQFMLEDLSAEEQAKYNELLQKMQETSNYDSNGSKAYNVPDAPFRKNWHELAMKRMLRLAAEEGYDKVAWTKGIQQASRYAIGSVVSDIEYVRIDSNGNRRYVIYDKEDTGRNIYVDENGIVTGGFADEIRGKKLSEVVGADIAEQMLQMEEGDDINVKDLTIGGEGMKTFYDKMLPQFMNKYGKKWGVKVDEITLPDVEAAGRTMWSIDVTPEMKESVMQGQPLFSARRINVDDAHRYLLEPEGNAGKALADYRSRNKFEKQPIFLRDEENIDYICSLIELPKDSILSPDEYREYIKSGFEDDVVAIYDDVADMVWVFEPMVRELDVEDVIQYIEHEHIHAIDAKFIDDTSYRDKRNDVLLLVKEDPRFDGLKKTIEEAYHYTDWAKEAIAYVFNTIDIAGGPDADYHKLLKGHKDAADLLTEYRNILRNGTETTDPGSRWRRDDVRSARVDAQTREGRSEVVSDAQTSDGTPSAESQVAYSARRSFVPVGEREERRQRRLEQKKRGFVTNEEMAQDRQQDAIDTAYSLNEREGSEVKVEAKPDATPQEVTTEWLHANLSSRSAREIFGDYYDRFVDDAITVFPAHLKTDDAKADYLRAGVELEERISKNPQWWSSIKSTIAENLEKAGVPIHFRLTDAEARYLLWRSFADTDSVVGIARDRAFRRKLGIGEFMSEEQRAERRFEYNYRTLAEQRAEEDAKVEESMASSGIIPESLDWTGDISGRNRLRLQDLGTPRIPSDEEYRKMTSFDKADSVREFVDDLYAGKKTDGPKLTEDNVSTFIYKASGIYAKRDSTSKHSAADYTPEEMKTRLYQIEEYKHILEMAKTQSTPYAKTVIDDVLLNIDYAIDYYKTAIKDPKKVYEDVTFDDGTTERREYMDRPRYSARERHPFDDIPSFGEPTPPRLMPGESILSPEYQERMRKYEEDMKAYFERPASDKDIKLSDVDLADALYTGDTSKIDAAKENEDWFLDYLATGADKNIKVSQRQMRRAVRDSIVERRKYIEVQNFEDARTVHNIIQRTTKEQREAIPHLLEGNYLKEVPERLRDVVDDIKSRLDAQERKTLSKYLLNMKFTGHELSEEARKIFEEVHTKYTDYRDLIGKAIRDLPVEITPELESVLNDIRTWFDSVFDTMEEEGLFTADEKQHHLENYVTHIWDKQKSDPKAVAILDNYNRLSSPYAKHRLIRTLEEGLDLGLKMKYTDIGDIMMEYGHYANEAIANKRMLRDLEDYEVTWTELSEDGTEVEHTQKMIVPINQYDPFNQYVVIDNNALSQYKVWKPLEGMMNVVYGPTRTKGVGDTARAIGHTFDIVGSLQKKINLALSFFHHMALSETGVGILGPTGFMKTLFKNIIWDAAVNRHEIWKAIEDVDAKALWEAIKSGHAPAFNDAELTKDAVEHLVQLGATQDYAAKDVRGLTANFKRFVAEKTNDKWWNPLYDAAALADFINRGMDTVLWDYLHDGLKLYSYKKLATDLRRKAAKNGWDKTKTDKALDEAGQFINDTFGGQHWDVLGYSPQTVKWLRRLLLSPDWTLSTLRQALSPFGVGQLYEDRTFWERMTKHEPEDERDVFTEREIEDIKDWKKARQKWGASFWITALLTFATLYNGLNAINRYKDEQEELEKAKERRANGEPDYKSPYELVYPDGMKWYDYTMFGNTLGKKTVLFTGRMKDGRERYARWGKQFRELPELFYGRDGLSIPFAFFEKMAGKLNPVWNTATNVAFGRGITGWENDIMKDKEGWERTWAATQVLATSFLPYSIPTNEDVEFVWTDLMMPSTKGYTPYKAKRNFNTAILSGDEDLIREVYKACVMNGLNADELLKTSIQEVQTTARKQMIAGVENLADAQRLYDESDDLEQKRRLQKYIEQQTLRQNYYAVQRDEVLQRARDFAGAPAEAKTNGEDQYILASTFADIAEDNRLKNIKQNLKKFDDEYKERLDVSNAEGAKYYKEHQKELDKYYDVKSALEGIRSTIKQMYLEGPTDKLMEEVRSIRRDALKE